MQAMNHHVLTTPQKVVIQSTECVLCRMWLGMWVNWFLLCAQCDSSQWFLTV